MSPNVLSFCHSIIPFSVRQITILYWLFKSVRASAVTEIVPFPLLTSEERVITKIGAYASSVCTTEDHSSLPNWCPVSNPFLFTIPLGSPTVVISKILSISSPNSVLKS